MIPSPYPGLRPFRGDEEYIFFGRKNQVGEILDRLMTNRFVAVVGPSGCGKTSLVQAGLLPGIDIGYMAGAASRWRVATMRPGRRPMRTLAKSLVDEAALGPERGARKDGAAFLLATLQRGPFGLLEILKGVSLPANTGFLLLVDQFEEIFRFRERYKEDYSGIDETDEFVNLLLASVNQRALPVYVIITMRSDFIGDCAAFSGLPEALNQSLYLTPRLTREQCREAIVGPAELFGHAVEPALVNDLINAMGGEPDQLPILQHALMRMWSRKALPILPEEGEPGARPEEEKHFSPPAFPAETASLMLTVKDYDAVGGLGRALSEHADDAYDKLNSEQKVVAEILFRCLTGRSSMSQYTRRPIKISEAARVAGAPLETVISIVESFRRPGRGFLTPPFPVVLTADAIIDISHESLIRQWRRLRVWSEKEAASSDRYRRLEETARLWEKGKSSLWRGPDLELALEWEEENKPTLEWAKRYGADFDLSMEFLRKSEDDREKRKQEREKLRQKELKKTRRALALTLVGLIIAVSLAVWGFLERTRAERAEEQHATSLFGAQIALSTLQARQENFEAALELLNRSHDLDAEIPPERRHTRDLLEWYTGQMGGDSGRIYEGAGAELLGVAVSPDASLLAAVGERGTAVIFDTTTGKLLKRLEGHEINKDVKCAVFHPEGKWLATAGFDSDIIIWKLPHFEKVRVVRAPDWVYTLALSPDGGILASAGADKDITLWNFESGEEVEKLAWHKGIISGLYFSRDGRLLASASFDKKVAIWNMETRKKILVFGDHAGEVRSVAFHPDGTILATGSSDKLVRLWEVESGKILNSLQGHNSDVSGVVFSNSGRLLASAGCDRTLRIWDVESGLCLRVLQGHKAGVNGLVAVNNYLFSASDDKSLMRWDMEQKSGVKIIDLTDDLACTAVGPNGAGVAVGLSDGGLQVYRLPDVQMEWRRANAHAEKIKSVVFSPDGDYVVSGSFDNTVKLWRSRDGRLVRVFDCRGYAPRCIAYSRDGGAIAVAGSNGWLGMFEIGGESERLHYVHDGKNVNSVRFDATGQRLVSAGDDGQVRIWSLENGELASVGIIPPFSTPSDALTWAAFSPDGKNVAVAGKDHIVRIAPLDGEKPKHELVGHDDDVYRVAFSPDGSQIASVSADATVRMWDLTTSDELFRLSLSSNIERILPILDFDFQCGPSGSGAGCWISASLPRGKFVLYDMGKIFEE